MATVWVVVDARHDYSSTKDYGELKFVFEGKVNVFASDALVSDVRDKLKDSTGDDFLCLSGTALANCVVYEYLMKRFGRVNVLIFSHNDGKYEVRTVRARKGRV